MSKKTLTDSVDIFDAIADPTRRRLMELLAQGERPVYQLAEAFEMTRPAISQHLAILRAAGLVDEIKRGRERHYHLDARPLRRVSEWIRHYEAFWDTHLDTLDAHLLQQTEETSP